MLTERLTPLARRALISHCELCPNCDDPTKTAPCTEYAAIVRGYFGRVVQPDPAGRCGHCGASGFSYRNGAEHSADGVRGYRCNTCGNIKAENWREVAP